MSQKLKSTCGSALVNEAKEYIKVSGKLKPGEVAVTDANKIKAAYLYHVALPIYDVQGKCQRVSQHNNVFSNDDFFSLIGVSRNCS